MTSCPSRFELRRMVAQDLEQTRAQEVAAHIVDCEACRAFSQRSSDLSASYFEREDDHLNELRSRLKQERVAPISRRGKQIKAAVGVAVALAASLLFVAVLPSTWQGSPSNGNVLPEGVAYRGTSALEVFVKRGELVEKVAPAAEMYEDDMLRFFITTDQPGFAAVVSIDAEGDLFTYYPGDDEAHSDEPMRLSNVGRVALPGSVVLDDSVGQELIILLFSEKPFDYSSVLEKVENIHEKTGQLPSKIGSIQVDSIAIQKAR